MPLPVMRFGALFWGVAPSCDGSSGCSDEWEVEIEVVTSPFLGGGRTGSDRPFGRCGVPCPDRLGSCMKRHMVTDSRRWWVLAVVGLAQFIVLLDSTVVNIALPSAQRALGMTVADRQWVITAYAVTFGGLLLLGGRLSDVIGRKRSIVVGVIGFAAASALAGASVTPAMLFAGRAAQGVFAALLAPGALSILSVTFPEANERGKAFGIFGAVAGSGAAGGLILGGVVTEYLGWRWCLYLSVPVSVVIFLAALRVLPKDGARSNSRIDVLGGVTGTCALACMVYGFSEAQPGGWTDPAVLAALGLGALVLVGFVLRQARGSYPLLPLRIVRHRTRVGCFLISGAGQICGFAVFLFMTYYLQAVRGYSPVATGFAFLPFVLSLVLSSTQIAARLLPKLAPRSIVVPGVVLAGCGLALLSRTGLDTPYVSHVLPALILIGAGLGLMTMTAMATATASTHAEDSGVTSALVNASQQVGGAVGTAVLNTIAVAAAAGYVSHHRPALPDPRTSQLLQAAGTVHGYSVALYCLLGLLGLALFDVLVLIRDPAPVRPHLERTDP